MHGYMEQNKLCNFLPRVFQRKSIKPKQLYFGGTRIISICCYVGHEITKLQNNLGYPKHIVIYRYSDFMQQIFIQCLTSLYLYKDLLRFLFKKMA